MVSVLVFTHDIPVPIRTEIRGLETIMLTEEEAIPEATEVDVIPEAAIVEVDVIPEEAIVEVDLIR
jgi:hypothetical protein